MPTTAPLAVRTLYTSEVQRVLNVLCERHNVPLPQYTVKFDLTGVTTHGRVQVRGSRAIGYSLILQVNVQVAEVVGWNEYMHTVRHEACHVFVFAAMLHRNVPFIKNRRDAWAAHGSIWQSAMRSIGEDPRRTATAENSQAVRAAAVARPGSRSRSNFTVSCGCSEHMVGVQRFNKIKAGVKYTCKICKSPVKPGPRV